MKTRPARTETKNSVEVALDHAFTEVKFATDGAPGTFSGYGAVFGNVDSHGDVIEPGAFADSLAEKKASGRQVPMHLMHRVFGGDGLPVGVFTNVEEDSKGLRVEGKISAMDTDFGKRVYGLVKDGALAGLSIGFQVAPNGAEQAKGSNGHRRTLKRLKLSEISLVDDPSNALTRIEEMKAALGVKLAEDGDQVPDVPGAIEGVAAAILIVDKMLAKGPYYSDSPGKDMAVLMDTLRDAHEELTGSRTPAGLEGWKNVLTLRDVERILRDGGASHTQARAIAEHGIKALRPREEGSGGTADPEVKSALQELQDYLAKQAAA